jgi:LysM repeat protein
MQYVKRFPANLHILLLILMWIGFGVIPLRTHAAPPSSTSPVDTVRTAGYIAPASQFVATISRSVDGRRSLSTGDAVVINAGNNRNIRVGDRFTIVRQSSVVRHPTTHHPVGTLVIPVGQATTTRVRSTSAVLRLTSTSDAVEIGDHVTRVAVRDRLAQAATADAAAADREPSSSAPERQLTGVIVATRDDKVSVGQGDVVYLDQGEMHGVRVGDRFRVFKRGGLGYHPVTNLPVQLPPEFLGELVVLEVHDRTSTALITASKREMTTGNVVELAQEQMVSQAGETLDKAALQAQAEDLRARLITCLETARQAIRAADTAGATAEDLAPARQALARAEHRLEQAQARLAQGDIQQARQLLEAAHADCLTARDLGQQASLVAGGQTPTGPTRYTVQRGDTLWGISGRPAIYNNVYMWPLVYRANDTQIDDPDVLSPSQVLAIPRDYTREEAETARHRARTRGPWRLGDGPDLYILKGVRP